MEIIVIGGGLAGSEAAYQVARRGIKVLLYEMRPEKLTPAHKTGHLAELVCSNSFKSEELASAQGLLKEELRRLGSLVMAVAEVTRVPGGKALCVDRELFARGVSEALEADSDIEIIREEVTEVSPGAVTVVATGPLTSPPLSGEIEKLIGAEHLYFYDAISPIVSSDSLQNDRLFFASRYGVDRAYLNCPLDKNEYRRLCRELVEAELTSPHDFEKKFFEGCLPVEELARRGEETLRFSAMKPVGLVDPKTQKRPYAVCQLRRENLAGTMYSLVGFQTRMRQGEQRRIFRLIPGLEGAEFLRYGSTHRNTYINSPETLGATLQTRANTKVLIAGQLTGVEGYLESTGMGLLAGINGVRLAQGKEPLIPPETTMLGALIRYLTSSESDHFQPMNANFGILPPPSEDSSRNSKKVILAQRALRDLDNWIGKDL